MKRKTIIIILLVIISIITFKLVNVYNIILERLYPMEFSEYVDKYSEKYGIEREWIYALIKAESNFDKNSVSSSGAIGLMQLMENTAKEMTENTEIEEVNLKEADINIELGTKYFSALVKYYDGNYNLAIAAYNAGIGRVTEWIEDGIIKNDRL